MSPTEPAAERAPRWLVPLALVLLAAFQLRDFLSPGLPVLFDAHSHLARSWFAQTAFEAGRMPTWTNDWYGGFRLFQFYAPGFYWIIGFLGMLLGDVVAATKAALWVGQILSLLLFYGLLRSRVERPLVALFGALLLLGSGQREMTFGVIGNHPTLVLYVCLPALLAWIGFCAPRRGAAPALFAGQALLMSAMAAGHFTNTLLILPAVAAFEVVCLWQAAPAGGERRRKLWAAGASFAAFAGLTAFVTVPMRADLDLVGLSIVSAHPFELGLRLTPLGILTGFAPHSFDHWFVRSQGLVWTLLALAGCGFALRRSGRAWLPFAAGLAAILGVVVLLDDRPALMAPFFLFPLCVAAVDGLVRALAPRGPLWGNGLAALALAAALLGDVTDIVSFRKYAPADAFDAYARLPETPTRSRTFDVTPTDISADGFYGVSSFSPRASGRAIPFGAYPLGAGLASYVEMALMSLLVHELERPETPLSQVMRDVLYLHHVEFLLDRREQPVLAALAAADESTALLGPHALRLGQASPAIFATQLADLPRALRTAASLREGPPRLLGVLEQRWRDDPLGEHPYAAVDPLYRVSRRRDFEPLLTFVRGMQIDRETATAERFYVESAERVAREPRVEAPGFRVIEHREQPERVEIVASAGAPGFVRLAYAHDPELRITLDGESWEGFADAAGAVLIRFPAGRHEIALRAPASGLRSASLAFSAALALLLAGLVVVRWPRTSTRAPR